MNKIINHLKHFDWILFIAILLLLCFGLIEIYSVALGQETVSLLNFKKQVYFICFGILLLFLFSFIDYHFLKNFSNYLYIAGAIILITLLISETAIRGTKGWFSFYDFGFQPVEFIKIILIIFLANFFSFISIRIRPLKHLILSGLGSLLFIILVLLQPDFGSALILLLIWLIMIAVAGFNKKYFLIIGLILIIAFSGSWLFFLKNYQKQRIITFLNPSADPMDQGYNISQAIIAVGSGRIMGRGVGFGSQSQLKFLPEAQNDFIFAVIAEELGFLSVCLVVLFFSIFYYRCLINLKNTNDNFAAFFIFGVAGLIFFEMFINIGMNIGILPIVGISLPFVSYGGSAIISHLILIGMIESIIIKSKNM
ncbi:MAG: FtsW/RodA/SpoVE family cell cycle protein [Patescibacteria group bacterium]|nr:rod shape-determining protein RodA [Patescibacteria group bacterium]MBU1160441.1 rod shape-determining protein RodA [Patescibacteria group bacterium]MBU1778516.1 rod shape-determining protein RodA [Patescibacteria group bacterium]MBU1987171.1 rod shape-determining protein RodA [Patescibacteria group bacterium]